MTKKNRNHHGPEGRKATVNCRLAATQRGAGMVYLDLPQARKYFNPKDRTCTVTCKHACKPKGQ